MADLMAECLAELDQREETCQHILDTVLKTYIWSRMMASTSLREIAGWRAILALHRPSDVITTRTYCTCDNPFPCPTVQAVARALGVTE